MDPGWPRFADSDYEFARYLRELKGSGSNLLVTGDVPDAITARATRILFGRGSQRYRVLAHLDTTSRIPDLGPMDEERLRVIEQSGETRSAPATVSNEDVREQADIEAVQHEIAAAIDCYHETGGGLAPAELRVCVGLSDEEDIPRIRQFLTETTALITEHHGMGHYHLPVPDNDPLVDDLSSLFDARIELRQEPGQPPEQRWHVPGFEKTTRWIEL